MFGIVKRPAVAGGADGSRGHSYTRRVDERSGRRLARSTAIFSLATGISRILGLVREVVAAYYFGAAGRINAFTVAFQVPNLVRALVADAALSSAFVPVFSDLLERGERRRAWRVASSLFWLMLLGLTALTALFVLVAPWVIGIFGNPGNDRSLAVGLSRVLFPIVALLGVSGIVVGILNSYDHFTVPTLSRLASRGDLHTFAEQVSSGLRQIAFLLAPTAVVSAVLAEPIIRILYQRGQWHPAQTPVVAGALAAFSAGLVFNGFMLMLNRAFFSLQSNWIPTWVALGNLGLNAILDFAFYRFGTWGIPLATAVCNVVSTAVLVLLLRGRLGRIGGTAIAGALGKIVVASALVAPAAYVVWRPLDSVLGRSFPGQAVSLGAALAAAGLTYYLACRALKVREMQALLSLKGRLSRG